MLIAAWLLTDDAMRILLTSASASKRATAQTACGLFARTHRLDASAVGGNEDGKRLTFALRACTEHGSHNFCPCTRFIDVAHNDAGRSHLRRLLAHGLHHSTFAGPPGASRRIEQGNFCVRGTDIRRCGVELHRVGARSREVNGAIH